MRIYKFGGASVKDAESIRNVATILKKVPGERMVVVISALDKTTNAMEAVADTYYRNKPGLRKNVKQVKDFHYQILDELFSDKKHTVYREIDELFSELEHYLTEETGSSYEFEYDQIVSYGELFGTKIISHFLNESGVPNTWFDARQLILTDDTFCNAKVYFNPTINQIKSKFKKFFAAPINMVDIALTQGFIARAPDGASTTLGREGSDYRAAIFGHALNAEEVVIWKDVPGLMNADPKYFPDAKKIDKISYKEVIELAYYGASVIHPKTIKPLENKNIPLYVKSFKNPNAKGTIISNFNSEDKIIPSFIFKRNQLLISISPKDFSFIDEENLTTLFSTFVAMGIKINVMQNSAISFSICIDDPGEKKKYLFEEIDLDFKYRFNEKLELLTIRNYNQRLINKITEGRNILLEQRSRYTVQLVLK
jgi:aspartate kinase